MKKALLIMPDMYTINDAVIDGLSKLQYRVKKIDYRKILRRNKLLAKAQTVLTSGKDKFLKTQKGVNKWYLKEYEKEKPDIVIIYNEELLLPSTLEVFSKRSKTIILLGDDPLNLNPPNKYNLAILFLADVVVCADSTWKRNLERIGLSNIIYDYIAYNPAAFLMKDDTDPIYASREGDLLFVGRSYSGSWGYKRCLFLDRFANLNIDIFGTGAHWPIWLDMFPNIKNRLILTPKKMPFNEMKELMHSYKIFPVDANPGIVSGLHLRVFECISAGILPLIEYTEDITIVFEDVPLPVVKNFDECEQLAKELLVDEAKRKSILLNARKHLNDRYAPVTVMNRILANI